jgi:hypothetical protein
VFNVLEQVASFAADEDDGFLPEQAGDIADGEGRLAGGAVAQLLGEFGAEGAEGDAHFHFDVARQHGEGGALEDTGRGGRGQGPGEDGVDSDAGVGGFAGKDQGGIGELGE